MTLGSGYSIRVNGKEYKNWPMAGIWQILLVTLLFETHMEAGIISLRPQWMVPV